MSDPFLSEVDEDGSSFWPPSYTTMAVILFLVFCAALIRMNIGGLRDMLEKGRPGVKSIFQTLFLHPKATPSTGDALLKSKNDAAAVHLSKVKAALAIANKHVVTQQKVDPSYQLNCSAFKVDGKKSSGDMRFGGGGGGAVEESTAQSNCKYVGTLLKEKAGDKDVARIAFQVFSVLN